MTFNDVRFNYGFKVQFVPALRSFLQHCIQVRSIGDDLACSSSHYVGASSQFQKWAQGLFDLAIAYKCVTPKEQD